MASSKDVIKSFTIKVNTKNGKVQIDGLTKSFQDAEKALGGLNKEVNTLISGANGKGGGLQDVSKISGSAAASVTEMGRVISDMPYGIRGVANNLSQLSANIFGIQNKTKSWSATLAALKAQLMGPLGILIGIQAVISALDFFSDKISFATKKADDFRKAAASGGSDLRLLLNQVEANNIGTRDMAESVRKANLEYKDLNIVLDSNGKLTEESTKAIRDKIKALEELAFANALLEEVEKKQEAVIEATLDARKSFSQETLDSVEALMKADEEAKKQFLENGGIVEMFYGKLDEFEEGSTEQLAAASIRRINRAKQAVNELSDIFGDDGIVNKVFNGDEKSGSGGRKRLDKIFKQQLLDLRKIILQNNKTQTLDLQRYENDKIRIQSQFAQDEIDLRQEQFEEKQRQRYKDYLASIKGHHNERALAEDANKKMLESIAKSETEAGEAKLAIRQNYANKLRMWEEENRIKQRATTATEALSVMNNAEALADPFAADANNELMEARRQAKLADIDERLKMERVGTDQYYNILKERLDFVKRVNDEEYASERAKIDKKKQINMEYAGFMATSASILKNIAGENEAMQKLALVVEKGAAVAKIVIGAQASIEARKAQHNAIPTFINVPTPTGMISIPNPAKAADKAAMLKANLMTKVGAGLSIANILSQTIKKKGGIKDGGKAEGGGREFDFNLVGSTGENQLAQVTAGQLNQPVQAYVVSSEITSQQQLDNNIQTNASFGDND